MPDDLFAKGLQIRREVLGDAYVDRAFESMTSFSEPLQELVTTYCWGATWGREGLSRKQRSLNNLCMLAVLNRPHELAAHVRGAIRNGCTLTEIQETLLQVGIYAGIPAAVDAFRVASQVLEEEGLIP